MPARIWSMPLLKRDGGVGSFVCDYDVRRTGDGRCRERAGDEERLGPLLRSNSPSPSNLALRRSYLPRRITWSLSRLGSLMRALRENGQKGKSTLGPVEKIGLLANQRASGLILRRSNRAVTGAPRPPMHDRRRAPLGQATPAAMRKMLQSLELLGTARRRSLVPADAPSPACRRRPDKGWQRQVRILGPCRHSQEVEWLCTSAALPPRQRS